STVIPETSSILFPLLLLTELFFQSSSLPIQGSSHCGSIRSMLHQVGPLGELSKKIHGLVSFFKNLSNCSQKHVELGTVCFMCLQVNETLPQLYEYTQSLRLHLNWLKIVKENVSLPFQSEEAASSHLRILSNLIKIFIPQQSEEALQSATPQLPVVSDAFDALLYSIEISDSLKVFCDWSKRVLRHFQRQSCSTRF
uniref:Uncharacterized protein n=1 Tax=Fundulus heteroclitus TaxID=8078 RepID=A0A3Q2TXJ5_FUNHE